MNSKIKSSIKLIRHTKLDCQAIHLYRLKLPQIATRQEKQKCKRHNTTGPYELRDDSDEERPDPGSRHRENSALDGFNLWLYWELRYSKIHFRENSNVTIKMKNFTKLMH